MKIGIKNIKIENFKGIKQLSLDLSDKTTINGANATGKSSVFDAVTWLLFEKNSLGVEKFDLRPLDADGNPIHYVEISVSATLDVDGKETELRKVQKENWVKSRGEEKAEFKGNVNEYSVNGFPKSERDYKAFINDMVSEDLFKMLSNPLYFPNMKWKDQREILMKLASKESDVEIAQRIGGFDELIPDLENATTTDDIRVKYAKALKELKATQSEIPVRIDEISKQKCDIDFSALELQKKALQEKLNGLPSDGGRKEEIKEINNRLMEIQFSIGEIIRIANESIIEDKKAFNDRIFEAETEINRTSREIEDLKVRIKDNERRIGENKATLEKEGIEYKAVMAETFPLDKWVFDEKSTVCSMCGQKLPADKIETLKAEFSSRREKAMADFEADKKARAEKLLADGYRLKGENTTFTETIATLESSVNEKNKHLESLKKGLEIDKEKLSKLPKEADLSQYEDYVNAKKCVEELETRLKELEESPTNDSEIAVINSDIADIDAQLAKATNNANIDERIEQLQTELKSIAQKIADAEKMLYLFDNFIMAKLDSISANINGHFRMAKWKLFETQINGGISECCEATYNGVPFSDLNRGHQILVGMDICRTLSEIYESNVFMFVDNAEAVNDFNMPDVENQLICLKVAENKELEVKNG